mmetsp:Transcript_14977/g.38898  ORF Transcript_14977/g.38898 Transcript_14977/m.38898 type:complete len:292 (+) Transcript_14977:44-919(+)
MGKVAVTTASGQLGGAIIRALVQSTGADNVIGVARTPEKATGLGVEVRAGDYGDQAQLTQAFADVEVVVVISLAGDPSKRPPLHRAVFEAAKAAGVRKVVYTSVCGPTDGASFDAIVKSNRETESDLASSGLAWVIGRNGIYIEPDVEYIDSYRKRGEVANCAADGKCGYTTRDELAAAYAHMAMTDALNSRIMHLTGPAITQAELVGYLNGAFGTNLVFRNMSVDEYLKDRQAELGEFMGAVIAGIYDGIRQGAFDPESEFEAAAGRPHITWEAYFSQVRAVAAKASAAT